MAIAIRGTNPAIGSSTVAAVSLSLTGATQPQTGDLLVIIHCNDYYALTNMPTPTVGGSTTGVTAITGASADAGTNLAHAKGYSYVVGSTGDLTVAVTETGTGDEEKALIVFVLSGGDVATPVDAANNGTGTASSSWVCSSVSPSSADAFLILHGNSGGGSAFGTFTWPSGELYDQIISAGMNITGAVEQLGTSGATGTRTATGTGSLPYASLTIAVKTGSAAAGRAGSPLIVPGAAAHGAATF